jgi:hypothetical protein
VEDIEELSVGLISIILSHQSLAVMDEDSLYEFIHGIAKIGLFEFVRFRCVLPAKVENFIDFVLSHFGNVNTSLLRCLQSRFQKCLCKLQVLIRSRVVPEGLIAHLTHQTGGNVHDYQLVNITSSEATFRTVVKSVANSNDASDSWSDLPDSWVCVAFKGMRIRQTRDVIKSGRDELDGHHMKNWVVEGFADNKWITFDRRIHDDSLNFANPPRTFRIMKRRRVSRTRIRQIDINHHGDHALTVAGLEIFIKLATRSMD